MTKKKKTKIYVCILPYDTDEEPFEKNIFFFFCIRFKIWTLVLNKKKKAKVIKRFMLFYNIIYYIHTSDEHDIRTYV